MITSRGPNPSIGLAAKGRGNRSLSISAIAARMVASVAYHRFDAHPIFVAGYWFCWSDILGFSRIFAIDLLWLGYVRSTFVAITCTYEQGLCRNMFSFFSSDYRT